MHGVDFVRFLYSDVPSLIAGEDVRAPTHVNIY